ncbi:hypothetical protein [Micromonospora sp.]|uniref:hypothetical protein n=1 Tax=Micromonospora sp. TaxID=1876 RepID=UPI003B3B76AE
MNAVNPATPLGEAAPDGPTWAVLAVGGAATVLLTAVVVLAITGVIRPLWSRPATLAPAQSAAASYRSPPPMVVDLRLTVPTIGDQP